MHVVVTHEITYTESQDQRILDQVASLISLTILFCYLLHLKT